MAAGVINNDSILPGLVQNPNASSIYATAAAHAFVANGVVHITMENLWPDNTTGDTKFHRVVGGQLVMSLAGAVEMVKMLSDILARQSALMIAAAAEQPPGGVN